jgi:hypothetical protein
LTVTKDFIAFYLGCALCFLLQTRGGLTSVTASAAIGLGATFIPIPKKFNDKFNDKFDSNGFAAAVYTGTFAGMCSRDLLATHQHVFILSILGAVIYVLAKQHFVGFGGKLGAVAFSASLLFLLARSIL